MSFHNLLCRAMKLKKKPLNGYTLVEVLIAIVIIGISFLAISKFQSHMVRSNVLAKQRSEAIAIAQGSIEKFRSQIVDSQAIELIESGTEQIQSKTTLFTNTWSKINIDNLENALANDVSSVNRDNQEKSRKNTSFASSDKLNTANDIEINVSVTWPDISNINAAGVAEASDLTTIHLISIISSQPYSDAALIQRKSKSPPIRLLGQPSPMNDIFSVSWDKLP